LSTAEIQHVPIDTESFGDLALQKPPWFPLFAKPGTAKLPQSSLLICYPGALGGGMVVPSGVVLSRYLLQSVNN